MFFSNIAGEEMLWRGYIQSRLTSRFSWLLGSCFWMIFHIPFGVELMILLIPVILIIPYVFYQTHNTLTGVFIHGHITDPCLSWLRWACFNR
jgi:membrane protease YdiL (CAAX protease family)